jgi:hypothetical protein
MCLAAGPSRSSGAISEACKLAGTDNAECATEESAAAPAAPISRTALVSSSTNSGTPSARAAISSTISGGNAAFPATFATIAAVSRRSSRASVSIVTCGCPVHGG